MGQHWSKQYYLGRNLCSCGACTDYQTQKRVFVKQQVIFEPDRSRTNINNFIEAWHNYLLSLYYEVVKIQPPALTSHTREVTSPDRSWSYEVDVERKSSTRENMDIPN